MPSIQLKLFSFFFFLFFLRGTVIFGEPEALQEQGLAFNNACYCQARS